MNSCSKEVAIEKKRLLFGAEFIQILYVVFVAVYLFDCFLRRRLWRRRTADTSASDTLAAEAAAAAAAVVVVIIIIVVVAAVYSAAVVVGWSSLSTVSAPFAKRQ